MSARIRRKSQGGDSGIAELRWNEKNIAKILRQWNAVYAQGEDMDDASHDDDDDEEMIPVHEEPKRAHEPEEDQAGHQAEPSQRVKA